MSLGTRIKRERIRRGLTQEQLGRMVNLSKANISKYESNVLEPNVYTLKLFATIFNCSLDYILGFSDLTSSKLSDEFKYHAAYEIFKEPLSKMNIISKEEPLPIEKKKQIYDFITNLILQSSYDFIQENLKFIVSQTSEHQSSRHD